jgi:c-di-GMP-binding flagellar brake protein YcgR
MLEKSIKVGNKAEIGANREEPFGQGYLSRVDGILPERKLRLLTPISRGKLVKPPVDSQQGVTFFTDNGVLSFDTVVLKYENPNNIDLMHVKLVTEGERIQRREFFRFTCSLPAKLLRIDLIADDGTDIFDAVVLDIGGGGAKLASKAMLHGGSRVKMAVSLLGEHMVVGASVLSAMELEGEYKCQCRLKFLGITPAEQEAIISFIFSEQRKSLQSK